MTRIALLVSLIGVGAVQYGGAQETPRDTVDLSEIVVTPTRTPMSRTAVSQSVTVLLGTELRARGISRVADALRLAPSAAVVQTGSLGGTTSLFLRGGESQYTRVLLDGIPLNEAGGAFDFANLTTASVERIEIVRGPVSVLYGSDAVAGVVQIFTRRGEGAPRWSINAMGGTFGNGSIAGSLTGGSETAQYGLHLGRFRSDGIYAFNNGYGRTELNGNVRIAPDPRTDATVSVQYGEHVYHVPTDGNGALTDHNAFQFGDDFVVGIDAGRYFTPRVEGRLLVSARANDSGFDDRPDDTADTLGFFASRSLAASGRRSADARVNLHLPGRLVLTAGGQVEQERERSFSQSESEFGPSNSQFDADRWNAAGYAQALGVAERVAWTVSGRIDRNQAFGWFRTYRAGVTLRPGHGLGIRGNVGTAFREPTFFENFAAGFVRGNPALLPEKTMSWDAGIEQSIGTSVDLRATWFDQRFRDLIDFSFSTPSPGDPNYYNVAAASSRGLELEVAWRGPYGWSATGAYTYLRSRVTDPGFDTTAYDLFLKGRPLVRRPAHSANVGVSFPLVRGVDGLVHVTYVGTREDTDYQSVQRVILPSYTLVDLAGSYAIWRRGADVVRLRVRTANLLDQRYESVRGFPAPGRSIEVGVLTEF